MQGFNHLQGMKVGSQVVFGRPNGEQTRGEVIKINRKSVKVRQTEVRYGNGRTRQEGAIWNVHPSCLKLDGGETYTRPSRPTPTPKTTGRSFKCGEKVSFRGSNGEIIEGIVKRVNAKTVSVEPHKGALQYWRVPHSLFI
jgi:hypothetical protein